MPKQKIKTKVKKQKIIKTKVQINNKKGDNREINENKVFLLKNPQKVDHTKKKS